MHWYVYHQTIWNWGYKRWKDVFKKYIQFCHKNGRHFYYLIALILSLHKTILTYYKIVCKNQMSCLWIKNSFICRHIQSVIQVNASYNKNGMPQSEPKCNQLQTIFFMCTYFLDTDYTEDSWQRVKEKKYLNYPGKWHWKTYWKGK